MKRGVVLAPPKEIGWLNSHAALPCADPTGAASFRVYFSGRDERNRSHIGAFDLRLNGDARVSSVSAEPILSPGRLGAFDDSGVTTSWVVHADGTKYLYYTGWALGVTVPFYFAVGLAVSEDGGKTFRRVSEAPVLDRSASDPFLTASPCVLRDGGSWRMWYVAGDRWEFVGDAPRHFYHIRYAESDDGVVWRREGVIALDFAGPGEYAFSRPSVRRAGDLYQMWFSVRGENYRIGYAESYDGIAWVRRDDAVGLEPSESGWDSEMLAYPNVFEAGGRTVMLYNGNGYGATGIGMAELA